MITRHPLRMLRPVPLLPGLIAALCLLGQAAPALEGNDPGAWREAWPETDLAKASVDFDEIKEGGPPKDGIPAIDDPVFIRLEESDLAGSEPVISLVIAGDARAYPLRILVWHEIVNDVVGGVPVTVTYCPLCNTGIVFDRRLDSEVLTFGATGKLRNSDLVMYDRETESWWQQFTGEAIVGARTGERLAWLPARLESFASFRERAPDGLVQVPNSETFRAYGITPYAGYDGLEAPVLHDGPPPAGIAPLARVVRIGDEAWALDLVRKKGKIPVGDERRIRWEAGQNSALDRSAIAQGRDVGNVLVERRTADGGWEDALYTVDFAFAFHAFFPDGTIHR
jgi:hypothetical protein